MTRILIVALGLSFLACSTSTDGAPKNVRDAGRQSEMAAAAPPAAYDVAQCDYDLLFEVAQAALEQYKIVEADPAKGFLESQLFGWRTRDREEYCTFVVRMRRESGSMCRFAVWALNMAPVGTRDAKKGEDEWRVVGSHRDMQRDFARRIYESYLLRAVAKGLPVPEETPKGGVPPVGPKPNDR